MKNYACINGKKIELTDEQIKSLGFITGESIEELSKIVRSGKAREKLQIRDIVNLNGYAFEIIGFDHDKSENDPDLPTITLMSKSLLPARRMHPAGCENGWIDTELREWLNGELYDSLWDELKDRIQPVAKVTHNYKGDWFKTVDKLFIPSESEYFGSAIYSDYEDGPRYEAFSTSEHRVRYDEDGDGNWYWSRSSTSSTSVAFVSHGGPASSTGAAHSTIRVPLCFCFS